MLPPEAIRIGSELVKPIARRLVPKSVIHFFGFLGTTVSQWNRTVQAMLPEPVVVCIKMLLAWILLPLIVLAFLCAPGIAKVIIGIILAHEARKAIKPTKP